jgi:hypothetical protein
MLGVESRENFIHRLLVTVHTSTNPQVIVVLANRVIGGERGHRGDLFELFEIARELVLHEDSALRGTEVGAALLETLLVEGFVDDTDSWTTANRNANECSDMVQVTFGEASGSIERINPDNHLIFKKLIRKFIVVEIGLRGGHSVNLLELL